LIKKEKYMAKLYAEMNETEKADLEPMGAMSDARLAELGLKRADVEPVVKPATEAKKVKK
jgi:hypothetical protein